MLSKSCEIQQTARPAARKTLSGASFESTAQLTQAIEVFIAAHNKNAAPFVWRKREVKGAQLRNTIVNLRN